MLTMVQAPRSGGLGNLHMTQVRAGRLRFNETGHAGRAGQRAGKKAVLNIIYIIGT